LKINIQAVEYHDGDTDLTGLFVWDDSQTNKRPGLLVAHGGAGLDDHAKGRARRFAELGYLAFACDLYGKGVAGDRQRIMARIAELRSDPAILCGRALAGLEVLRSHPLVDGRTAAVGYCFGGMTVLELARSSADVMGVVSVHGSLETSQPAQPSTVKAKILVCHGALDPHVPMTHVSVFIEEMKTASTDWQVIVYGNAMHGFTHNTGPKMPGVEYHALTDRRSAKAIQAFLAELFATSAA
jgi:dienelactone hydrolase